MFFKANPIQESIIDALKKLLYQREITIDNLDTPSEWIEVYNTILLSVGIEDINFDIVGEYDSYIQASLDKRTGTKYYYIVFDTSVGYGNLSEHSTEDSIAYHLSDVILGANNCRKDFNIIVNPKEETHIVTCNGCGVHAQVFNKKENYCCKSCAVVNNLISQEEEEIFGETAGLI